MPEALEPTQTLVRFHEITIGLSHAMRRACYDSL